MSTKVRSAPAVMRVIDFETTGSPTDEGAEVIELAYVDVDPHVMSVIGQWRSFATPVGPIPAQVKAVHHILEDDVAGASPIGALWPRLFAGCGADDVLVAHNAAFEMHFHAGEGRPWVDTYKCALVVWPEAPSHSNQSLRYWLELDRQANFDRAQAMPPHRALPDAYVTAHILLRLLAERTVENMIEISAKPALLRRLTFGKHKGTSYAEAPLDYLKWVADKADFNPDVVATARYWIARRSV